ncbi:hypothetical protein [uncultured Litoreibacter sp.]|uniref:hypothetical protein n=1 Tax=uncultured Litoreibacter sp. TaxID=1392394 RepID=UPI0026278492|nr:hypothetical protein [uncultured Litoreibacter sp.]
MIKKTALIASVALALSSSVAVAEKMGVVGLYSGDFELDDQAVTALGCAIQREGAIVAAQGKLAYDLTQPDKFVVLDCEDGVLGQADRRQAATSLFSDGSAIAIFEGALTNFPIDDQNGEVAKRQYVLKLGYYNNADVDAREQDLAALNMLAQPLDGHWINESFLQVHAATGIPTPDEVVVIHYESAEVADQFRAENADILKEVSDFNDAHLTSFTYLVGSASR